jgi:hypothetical protein
MTEPDLADEAETIAIRCFDEAESCHRKNVRHVENNSANSCNTNHIGNNEPDNECTQLRR